MLNWAKTIHAILTEGGTDLSVLVGSRVWCPSVPKGFTNDQAALVFERRGGGEFLTVDTDRVIAQISCYGGTAKVEDARPVRSAVIDRLKRRNIVTPFGALQIAEESGAQESFDDDETPVIWSAWRFQIATV